MPEDFFSKGQKTQSSTLYIYYIYIYSIYLWQKTTGSPPPMPETALNQTEKELHIERNLTIREIVITEPNMISTVIDRVVNILYLMDVRFWICISLDEGTLVKLYDKKYIKK